MCDCIEELEDRVRREKGAAEAHLEHLGNRKSEFWYRWITGSGELSKHNRYVLIPWSYCPFCGEEIQQR